MAKAKPLPNFDPAAIKAAMAPVVSLVPSQKVHHGEVMAPQAEPVTLDDFADAIRSEWDGVQAKFLRIGELLDRAQSTLAEPDYLALANLLPFGKAVRSQLLTAYRSIQSGRIPAEMAAAGYSTVYLLGNLSDAERAQAADAGLLHPDVSQAEVRRFIRDVRPAAPKEKDHAALMAERERLLTRLAEVEAALGLSN